MNKLLQELAAPYYLDVCRKITKNSELSGDLFSFLVLEIHNTKGDLSGKDLKRYFKYLAAFQFYKPRSKFNKLHSRKFYKEFNTVNYINEDIEITSLEKLERQERTETELDQLDQIKNEINKPPKNDRELLIRETMRAYLEHGSFQKTANATGLNVRTVYRAFEELKKDINDTENSNTVNV